MKLNYCLECASELKHLQGAHYTCEKGHSYWNNPRAAVAVVIMKNDKILVSKRGIEPRKGTYDLPGGFLEPNETVEEAAVREIREETTVEIENIELISSYSAEYLENIWVCDIVVLAKTWHGSPIPNDDSEVLEWKPIDFLKSPEFTAPYENIGADISKAIN